MEGGTKYAVAIGLVVVIVAALVLVIKKQSGDTPPPWVMEQPQEKIDIKTNAVMTKTLGEWEKLGQKDTKYKNPDTGEYTMVSPMTCAACQAVIPSISSPADMELEQMEKWQAQQKCPKCTKNPFTTPAP